MTTNENSAGGMSLIVVPLIQTMFFKIAVVFVAFLCAYFYYFGYDNTSLKVMFVNIH